jgi:GT2 family glycosyltransferase
VISAVVVSYRAMPLLARCLERLAEELPAGSETVVVDNASGDGTAEAVRRRFPGVRLLELPANLGFGGGVDRGVAAAGGDELLLLNPDAWPAPGAVAAMRAALAADPRVGLVAPQLRFPDGRPQFTWVPPTGVLGEAAQMARNRFEGRPWAHGRALRALLRPLGRPWYSGACLLLRRAAFEAVGGFDESLFLYFEDVDLCRRLERAGWRLVQERGATVYHLKGGSGDRGPDVELAYRRSQLAYYRKHRPRWERLLVTRRLRRRAERCADRELAARLLALL